MTPPNLYLLEPTSESLVARGLSHRRKKADAPRFGVLPTGDQVPRLRRVPPVKRYAFYSMNVMAKEGLAAGGTRRLSRDTGDEASQPAGQERTPETGYTRAPALSPA